MHILMVDDVADTRELFAWFFRLEGHTVHTANNGAEAVAAMELEPHDAIVMDMNMPEMDGVEAIRHIRQLPQGQALPIILVTGDTAEERRAEAILAGASTVTYKPILPSFMLKHIEDYQPKS